MPGQLLHVAQAAPGLYHFFRRPGDERPSSGVRRAARQPQGVIEGVKPHGHGVGREPAAAFRVDHGLSGSTDRDFKAHFCARLSISSTGSAS